MNAFVPMNDMVFDSAMALFSKMSLILVVFVSGIVLIRFSLLAIQVASGYEYFEVVKDTVTYFALIWLFPHICRMILDGTTLIASKIAFTKPEFVDGSVYSFFDRLLSDYPLFMIFGKIGSIVLGELVMAIYTILVSLLLAAAPIIIFMNTILGMSHGVRAFIVLFASLCLWPVLWNLLGLLGSMVTHVGDNPLLVTIFWFVIQVLQLASPILSIFLIRNFSRTQGFKGSRFGRS